MSSLSASSCRETYFFGYQRGELQCQCTECEQVLTALLQQDEPMLYNI